MFHNWSGAGITINAGQDIVIDGCRIGSNAQRPAIANSGGVNITGTPANILIAATDLSGTVPGDLGPQPYAISITAAVQGLYVNGCILSGNATAPLFLSGAGNQIEITNCTGYNDLATILTATGATPPSGEFHNYSTWANAASGWFGPLAFYIWGSGVTFVHIDGVKMALFTGSFELGPGERATIDWSGTPSFLAVGK
jgi:hypothetical protein